MLVRSSRQDSISAVLPRTPRTGLSNALTLPRPGVEQRLRLDYLRRGDHLRKRTTSVWDTVSEGTASQRTPSPRGPPRGGHRLRGDYSVEDTSPRGTAL